MHLSASLPNMTGTFGRHPMFYFDSDTTEHAARIISEFRQNLSRRTSPHFFFVSEMCFSRPRCPLSPSVYLCWTYDSNSCVLFAICGLEDSGEDLILPSLLVRRLELCNLRLKLSTVMIQSQDLNQHFARDVSSPGSQEATRT